MAVFNVIGVAQLILVNLCWLKRGKFLLLRVDLNFERVLSALEAIKKLQQLFLKEKKGVAEKHGGVGGTNIHLNEFE